MKNCSPWRFVLTVLFLLALPAACAPPTTEEASPVATVAPTDEAEMLGCAAGGLGVFTPEDVRCTLDSFSPEFVREIDEETAVYQAAIFHEVGRDAVVQQTTTTELYNPGGTLADAIDPNLLQAFILANQAEMDLSYLFLGSTALSVQPKAVIERDYLPPTGSTPDCERFRREYGGLGGGVITLSQIGFSADGQQAVLFMRRECGDVAVTSAYFVLNRQGQSWQVAAELGRVEIDGSTPLIPELIYNGRSQGCGDIFLYKANSDSAMSEYVVMAIDVRSFDLPAQPLTLELAEHPESIVARIDLFGDRVYNFGEFPYCNDVGPSAQPQAVWQAERGKVTVSIHGAVPEEPCMGEGYNATVRLENVVFRNGAETVQLDELLFEDVPVGWCAG